MAWARSAKERSLQADSQSAGKEGISSGMKRPPSDARPLRTTSSKESCRESYQPLVKQFIRDVNWWRTLYSPPRVLR